MDGASVCSPRWEVIPHRHHQTKGAASGQSASENSLLPPLPAGHACVREPTLVGEEGVTLSTSSAAQSPLRFLLLRKQIMNTSIVVQFQAIKLPSVFQH